MDVGNKNMFKDMLYVVNYELSLETKVGQKGKTFHFKRGNYVQSGTRQHNAQMFDDHLRNTYCFEGTT